MDPFKQLIWVEEKAYLMERCMRCCGMQRSVRYTKGLEKDFEGKLYLAREVLLSGSDGTVAGPGAGIIGVGHLIVTSQGVVDVAKGWTTEDRGVGEIEGFGLELKFGGAVEADPLFEADLSLLCVGCANLAGDGKDRRGGVGSKADLAVSGVTCAKCLNVVGVVEPGLVATVSSGTDVIAPAAGVGVIGRNIVASGCSTDGCTAGVLEDPVELPAADELVDDAVGVVEEGGSATEGKGIEAADGKVVGAVCTVYGNIGSSVDEAGFSVVEEIRGIHRFGVGERDEDTQAAKEGVLVRDTALQLSLKRVVVAISDRHVVVVDRGELGERREELRLLDGRALAKIGCRIDMAVKGVWDLIVEVRTVIGVALCELCGCECVHLGSDTEACGDVTNIRHVKDGFEGTSRLEAKGVLADEGNLAVALIVADAVADLGEKARGAARRCDGTGGVGSAGVEVAAWGLATVKAGGVVGRLLPAALAAEFDTETGGEAKAAAKNERGGNGKGDTDLGQEVANEVLVGGEVGRGELIAAEERVGNATCSVEDGGDRVDAGRAESRGELLVAIHGGSFGLPTEAQIKGQILAGLPVILDVGGVIVIALVAGVEPVDGTAVGIAEEDGSDAIAIADIMVGILLGELLGKGELAVRASDAAGDVVEEHAFEAVVQAVRADGLVLGDGEVVGLEGGVGGEVITDEVGSAAVEHVDFGREGRRGSGNDGHVETHAGSGEGGRGETGCGASIGIFADGAIPGGADVKDAGRGEGVGDVEDGRVGGAVIVDVALRDGGGETGGVAILLSAEVDEHAVSTGLVGEVMIDTNHGLVVGVATRISRNVIITVVVAGDVGLGEELEEAEADSADAVGGDGVIGKLVASVILAGVLADCLAACGGGIVDVVSAGRGEVFGQVDAAIDSGEHVGGSDADDNADGEDFTPSFEGEEEVGVFAPGVPPDSAAELVLVVEGLGRILLVELEGVGVEDGVAPEVV